MAKMMKTESLEDFYKHKAIKLPDNLRQDVGHFNVFRMEDVVGPNPTPSPYTRRDFYKISLLSGKHIFHYADKSIEVDGSTLMFFSSHIPYTVECHSTDNTGFFCVFKEAFFTEKIRGSIKDLPMFKPGSKPGYTLDKNQDMYVSEIFRKMQAELESDYAFKYDLILNYVTELIHYAMKMKPSETLYQHPDANARITAVFTELLDRQFPIESPSQRLTMRSAKDYAEKLAVHINHLNRALRLTTGKTTTDHIAERLTSEAIALLKHTNWNIAEISYSLGFEEPAHFTHFLKKHTRQTPSMFRVV